MPTTMQVDLREEDVSRVYCVSKEELKSIFPHKLSTKFSTMVRQLISRIIIIALCHGFPSSSLHFTHMPIDNLVRVFHTSA